MCLKEGYETRTESSDRLGEGRSMGTTDLSPQLGALPWDHDVEKLLKKERRVWFQRDQQSKPITLGKEIAGHTPTRQE